MDPSPLHTLPNKNLHFDFDDGSWHVSNIYTQKKTKHSCILLQDLEPPASALGAISAGAAPQASGAPQVSWACHPTCHSSQTATGNRPQVSPMRPGHFPIPLCGPFRIRPGSCSHPGIYRWQPGPVLEIPREGSCGCSHRARLMLIPGWVCQQQTPP